MDCRTVLSIAALSALTACQSPGGLAQRAPAWTATYQVPYDTMANCLVERERLPWVNVTPSIYPAERRATVAVTTPTGSALGVYDIRQISGRDTEVAYRSIYGGPGSGAGGDALEKANRCGNPGARSAQGNSLMTPALATCRWLRVHECTSQQLPTDPNGRWQ